MSHVLLPASRKSHAPFKECPRAAVHRHGQRLRRCFIQHDLFGAVRRTAEFVRTRSYEACRHDQAVAADDDRLCTRANPDCYPTSWLS